MKNKLRLRPRLVLGLIIMSTVLVLTLTALGGAIYRRKMEVVYSREAFDTASIAAQLIDGDRIAEYRKTLKKDAYFRQTVQHIIGTYTSSVINLGATREDWEFMTPRIYQQYVEQYDRTYPAA